MDDLGSQGLVRLPFQFGKPDVDALYATAADQMAVYESVVKKREAEFFGWDSLGTPTTEFDHG